jgi:SAM-dependent methyltransferase
MTDLIRLDLGAENISPPGFIPMGHDHGTEIYPLAYDDDSVDVIRASHVLEHFPTAQVPEIVKHWASKLKPGGVLKIAVPNFAYIAQAYLDGKELPIEGYTMGGQTDADDFHKALFDAATLTDLFRGAGLTDIGLWDSDADDCSRLPVSLNMRAVKPVAVMPGAFKIAAVMSMPRLGFTDNFTSCHTALAKLGIEVNPFVGAFWGQCLERGLEMLEQRGFDAILTIDYDTVFSAENVKSLMRLMMLHPEADAIAPLQSARGWNSPLLTMEVPEGVDPGHVPRSQFRCGPGAAKDRTLRPDADPHVGATRRAQTLVLGQAGARRVVERWSRRRRHLFLAAVGKAGKTLFNANRVVVGHLELMIKWPGRDLSVTHQRVADYWKDGPPQGVWK